MKKLDFIKNELYQLDVPKGSRAYDLVYTECLAAMDLLSKKELKQLIEDHLDVLPNSYFY